MHPDSFEIPYENIKSVKLSNGLLTKTLEIKALLAGEEKKFKLSIPKKYFEDVKNIVNKYLPESDPLHKHRRFIVKNKFTEEPIIIFERGEYCP